MFKKILQISLLFIILTTGCKSCQKDVPVVHDAGVVDASSASASASCPIPEVVFARNVKGVDWELNLPNNTFVDAKPSNENLVFESKSKNGILVTLIKKETTLTLDQYLEFGLRDITKNGAVIVVKVKEGNRYYVESYKNDIHVHQWLSLENDKAWLLSCGSKDNKETLKLTCDFISKSLKVE